MGEVASHAMGVLNHALDESSDEELGENSESDIQLRVACYRGDAIVAQKLIDKQNANARSRDRHGWSALHWACKEGDVKCIELLIDAVKNDKGKVSAYLNAADTLSGWTALHVACINAKKEAIKTLINLGCNSDKKTKFDESPVELVPAAARNAKHIRRLFGIHEEKHIVESKEAPQNESKHSEEKQ
jgi:ankyrin repeat protein